MGFGWPCHSETFESPHDLNDDNIFYPPITTSLELIPYSSKTTSPLLHDGDINIENS